MNTIKSIKLILLQSNIEEFKKSLEHYDINQQDEYGNNILHYYIKESKNIDIDCKEIIDIFLEKGMRINDKQLYGRHNRSPLHLAVFMKYEEIVNHLIEIGADINSTDGNGNPPIWTAIMFCRGGSTYFIEKLITSGANIDLKNNHGNTPRDILENLPNNKHIFELLS